MTNKNTATTVYKHNCGVASLRGSAALPKARLFRLPASQIPAAPSSTISTTTVAKISYNWGGERGNPATGDEHVDVFTFIPSTSTFRSS